MNEQKQVSLETLLAKVEPVATDAECGALAQMIHAYFVNTMGVPFPPLVEVLALGILDGKSIEDTIAQTDEIFMKAYGRGSDAASVSVFKRGLRYLAVEIERLIQEEAEEMLNGKQEQ